MLLIPAATDRLALLLVVEGGGQVIPVGKLQQPELVRAAAEGIAAQRRIQAVAIADNAPAVARILLQQATTLEGPYGNHT